MTTPLAFGARVVAALLLGALLSACGGGGGGNQADPDPVPPPPVPTGSAPAATLSRSGNLVMERQDPSTSAGGQVSRSTRYTLINEGLTP